jgi:Zn-finger nucleic acid-binding protein
MAANDTLICPKCHGEMRTYERSGVLVDQCGECRGVFLDRGELERLMDAEMSAAPVRDPGLAGSGRADKAHGEDREHDRERERGRERDDEAGRRDQQGRQIGPDGRRRESRLGGIFDLFGGDWQASGMSPETMSINTLAALLGLAPALVKLTLSKSGVRLAPGDRASESDLARVFGASAVRGFFERARDRAGRGSRATSIEPRPAGRRDALEGPIQGDTWRGRA